MFGELLELPVRLEEVTDPDAYYSGYHGSQLVLTVLDGAYNVVARGFGMQFNEQYQKQPVMEWGHKHCVEIVTGAMPPGQLTIQTLYFAHYNDVMPTHENLVSRRELQAIVQVASHEDDAIAGLVLDVFEGVHIAGQNGNWNAQNLYMRNGILMYRKRITGLKWADKAGADYPASGGDAPKGLPSNSPSA